MVGKVDGLKISKMRMKSISHTYDVITKHLFNTFKNVKFGIFSKLSGFDQIKDTVPIPKFSTEIVNFTYFKFHQMSNVEQNCPM